MWGRIWLSVLLAGTALAVWLGVNSFDLTTKYGFTEQLGAGKTYSGTLTGSNTATYRFQVAGNQYFTFGLDNPAGDITLVLSSPDGRVRRSVGCFYGRAAHISEVSPPRGSKYLLEVRRCLGDLSSSTFGLEVHLGQATQRDSDRVIAERAQEDADRLVSEYGADSRKAADQKYNEALQGWLRAGDPVGELRTLHRAAELARDLGQIDKSTRYLDQALSITREGGQPAGEAETLMLLSTLHLKKGDSSLALKYCEQAINMIRSVGNQGLLAEALLVLGDIYYERSELTNALDANQQAYFTMELENPRGLAKPLIALAEVYTDQAEYELAMQHTERALSLFVSFGERQGEIRSRANLGRLLARMGRKQEALDSYERARSLLRESGDLYGDAVLLGLTGIVYADLGRNDIALQYFTTALDNYRRLNHRSGEAIALRRVGEFNFYQGNTKDALESLELAAAAFRQLSNKRVEAFCLRDIGIVYESLKDFPRAIQYFNKSLELNRAEPNNRLEASALFNLGHVYESRNQYNVAIRYYQRALELNRSSQDRFGEIQTLHRIAYSLGKLGLLKDALRQSRSAIEAVEKLRASLVSTGLRTSYFASVKKHYELEIDLLMGMRKTSAGSAVEALEMSERSRSRALLDSIAEARASISEGADRALLSRELSLRTSLDAKSERYTQLLSLNPHSKEAATLDDDLRRLNVEYEELIGQLRTQSPGYAALIRPQPVKVKEIQQLLSDRNTLLLEYALGEENIYLWAVTDDDVKSFVLPKRSEIEERVHSVLKLLTARSVQPGEKPADYQSRIKTADAQFPAAAAELSESLLGPVSDLLGSRRLVIVAEGALQYLPFHALPAPQSAQRSDYKPLLFDHEIVNLPSASTLSVIRNQAPFRSKPDQLLAIFADPVFEAMDGRLGKRNAPAPSSEISPDTISLVLRGSGADLGLPRLLSTRREAQAIAAVVPENRRLLALDFQASKAAVMNSNLDRYRILHFATHTLLNDDHPELSSLVLSLFDERGRRLDGHLRLRDIYNLKLSAELVVLSACETALGKEVKGEGLMSMVRGFMYSGTPRVLASLWKVDDDATAELMEEFYKQLFKEGLTPAAALRQAQIKQSLKKSKQTPYYWAGFQLQGEWK